MNSTVDSSTDADLTVDILITNHNYGEFVTEAIESARAQDHPHVRIVVVDDGSTDNSRDILSRYANTVEVVLKENGGQASAINAGMERCRSDVVMMLDADDLLKPHAASKVAAAFAADPRVVKVQTLMEVIDADGRPTGATKPPRDRPMPNGDMRLAELTFPFDLPWVPTSGNAFRTVPLSRILPIPEADYPLCAESYLIHLAALLGPVVSINEAGTSYREHRRNHYDIRVTSLDLDHLRQAIRYMRVTTRDLTRLADRLGLDRPAQILSTAELANRMTSWRLDPEAHPVPNERTGRLLADAIRAIHRRFDVSLPMKTAFVIWFALSAVAPRRVVCWLGEVFHSPEKSAAISRTLRWARGGPVVNCGRTTPHSARPIAGSKRMSGVARSLGHDLAVDILITNYNYGAFVAAAIKSACVQNHPIVHVIVVDDGSTDNSRDLLGTYANEVELVLKKNGGQASAINAGIARCRGDIVMLLDADDVLMPDAASRVAAAFAADLNVVKVQSVMGVIDAEGRVTGETKPLRYMPMLNGDMRKAELTFPFDLPWVPTSANAFRTDAVRSILPIPEMDYPVCGGEQYLIHLAALLGPVVSLDEVGAFYRVHGRNFYEVPSTRLDLDHLRLAITLARATTRGLTRLADRLGLDRPARILSTADLGNRMTSWRLEPHAHPVPNERTGRLLADAIRAIHRRFDISLTMKCALVGWFVLSAVSPRPVVRWLGELFHVPEKTPAIASRMRRTHGISL